jgi:hypothetical protein
MSVLGLTVTGQRSVFAPGDVVDGVASWRLDAAPQTVEVRLFWYTKGKGTRDVGITQLVSVATPGAAGEEHFKLVAPQGPPSFSGRLISLQWALELVVEPGSLAERVELVIAPEGREIVLHPEGASPVS